MKVEIRKRFSDDFLFAADVEGGSDSVRLGRAVLDAVKAGADLRGADLRGADLSGANLIRANLSGANLSGANLIRTSVGGKGCDLSSVSATYDPDLPSKVAKVVASEGCSLNMDGWHICETTHCLGGWAVYLSGPAGKALEAVTSTSVAAAILMPSASHLFYSVSIHAPVRARQSFRGFRGRRTLCFNPRAREGATRRSPVAKLKQSFNPRAREGATACVF